MTDTTDTQPGEYQLRPSADGVGMEKVPTPAGSIESGAKLRVNGACLIEIWRTARHSAPNCFWREMQADGIFSLWRLMEPSFAKKALAAERFTLEKDGHVVLYAARVFDTRTAELHDYNRLRKLVNAFKSTPDPTLLCADCWGTKEIQATRVKIDAATNKPIGTERFVCDCPTCAPKLSGRKFRIVAEVPGVQPSEAFYVTGPDLPPVNFATYDAAFAFLKGIGAADDEIKYEGFEP